jgi:hypothetical protein
MKTQVDRVASGNTLAEIKDAVIKILESSVKDLKTSKTAGETDKFFPKGINFISIDVSFDPSKLTFHGALIVSSEPVKTSLDMADEITVSGQQS